MDYLSKLENQSIYILREAFNKFENLAMLWSIGKDSTVLLWLARKAFFGHVPFPLVHVDTTYKIPSMIEYRDRLVKNGNFNSSSAKTKKSSRAASPIPTAKHPRRNVAALSKRTASSRVLDKHHFTGGSSVSAATRNPPAPKNATSALAIKTWKWNVERPAARALGSIQKPILKRAHTFAFIPSSIGPS